MRQRRMRHLVEAVDRAVERVGVIVHVVQVAEAGDAVDDLHGPDTRVLRHHEARPETAVRSGVDVAEHDDGGVVESLAAEACAHLAFEGIRPHVLPVDGVHAEDDGIDVGTARRGGPYPGPQRTVRATQRGVGVVEHAGEDEVAQSGGI